MSTSPLPLSRLAILVHPDDDVAVARVSVAAGTRLVTPGGDALEVTGRVELGHRFALRPLAAGALVHQYGEPIGTSRGIGTGDPVTLANLDGAVPLRRDIPDDLANPAPVLLSPAERPTFHGYVRPDGRVGTRNLIALVPTSMCASHEALRISFLAEERLLSPTDHPHIDGIVALPHSRGCGCPDGSNLGIVLRTLAASAAHPNVGGVVFLHLGCEKTGRNPLEDELRERNGLGYDKPTAWVGIQEAGGTEAAVQQGLARVAAMLPAVNEARREEVSAEHLVLGVKCGGSDGLSGLSANPALGRAADRLVHCGGTVLITEVPEFCGAEHRFALRARDAATARDVLAAVDWYRAHAARQGVALEENPSPGNVAGGLLNIAIKSLGAMAKAGTTRVEGCTGYGEAPRGRGLHLMQGPGYDQESTPGLVAAGATAVVFTTGRGTTIGNALAPVIKLASNTAVFERMRADIDLSAGGIIDGTETIEEVGLRVFDHVLAVAGGRVPARAEVSKHREFQIWGEGAISL